jgi:drug/metabolite transporter (DMT)-like permease
MLVHFQWVPLTFPAFAMTICVGLLGALSHFAMIVALDYAEAGAIQPYAYTLLVWATALGYLVFGDMPDVWTLIGATIVVLGGLYSWREELGR